MIPGDIVKVTKSSPPWDGSEGLFLGDDEGVACVLWYGNQNLTLHWHYENLELKEPQEIDGTINEDFRSFLLKFQYSIQTGFIGMTKRS